jgi:alpha-glucuronidase
MASGRMLWDELVLRYRRGIDAVKSMRRSWAGLAAHVDAERHVQVAAFLAIQEQEAQWWRDASIAYWQGINGLPLPQGEPAPQRSLDEYKALEFPHAPGDGR